MSVTLNPLVIFFGKSLRADFLESEGHWFQGAHCIGCHSGAAVDLRFLVFI